jgi:mercuric ion transport protein
MDQRTLTTGPMVDAQRVKPSSVREAVSAYLSLFSSLSTLFCCALPAFLVLVGLSFTSVLGFFTAIPGWQKFGQHENLYYLISGILLALGFYFAYFRGSAAVEVCEIPTDGRVSACSTATRWNRRILWLSLFLYTLALVMNFWGIGWMRTHGYFNH